MGKEKIYRALMDKPLGILRHREVYKKDIA
jgi:hypothetical protein